VFTRLAELSVHGANVHEGQIVLVQAEIGLEEQARATAEAAYKRSRFLGGPPPACRRRHRHRRY
jgi:hypothetical protein